MRNPNIKKLADDVLYHFALGTKSHDLKSMFGDVKVSIISSPIMHWIFILFHHI